MVPKKQNYLLSLEFSYLTFWECQVLREKLFFQFSWDNQNYTSFKPFRYVHVAQGSQKLSRTGKFYSRFSGSYEVTKVLRQTLKYLFKIKNYRLQESRGVCPKTKETGCMTITFCHHIFIHADLYAPLPLNYGAGLTMVCFFKLEPSLRLLSISLWYFNFNHPRTDWPISFCMKHVYTVLNISIGLTQCGQIWGLRRDHWIMKLNRWLIREINNCSSWAIFESCALPKYVNLMAFL